MAPPRPSACRRWLPLRAPLGYGLRCDYRSSDIATSLLSTSNLVAAANGKSSCTGLQAVGGEGTYYPQVIYAAQAALVTAEASNPSSQNVLIILGDGDASSTHLPGASTTSGTYPSTINQCHQAITAAHAATTAGTRVYSVAYGSPNSGCSTDTSPSITACQTMEQMASAAQDLLLRLQFVPHIRLSTDHQPEHDLHLDRGRPHGGPADPERHDITTPRETERPCTRSPSIGPRNNPQHLNRRQFSIPRSRPESPSAQRLQQQILSFEFLREYHRQLVETPFLRNHPVNQHVI